jgi:hypothetical protein
MITCDVLISDQVSAIRSLRVGLAVEYLTGWVLLDERTPTTFSSIEPAFY